MRKTCPEHSRYVAANRCDPCRVQAARYEQWRQLDRLRSGPRMVNGIGTARRLQALAVVGWGAEPIAVRLGVAPILVERWRRGKPLVHRDTAARVAKVFRDLAMVPGPSPLAASRARAKGWFPPLAWDDIDDPAAVPQTGSDRSRGVQVEDVEWLLDGGCSLWEVASRLGVSVSGVEQACRRAGRADLIREVAS